MSQPLIQLINVSKQFGSMDRKTVKALEDISFDVQDGEFVSLVGASGCGKTTLLRIIAGLIIPTTGTVSLEGNPPRKMLKNMGFVFQTPTLFPWRSVLDNVLLPVDVKKLGRQNYIEHAKDLISLVGLRGFEKMYPFELSGGMQQRVSLARALVQEPRMLLMDEPFGALDAITREQMGIELLKIWSVRKVTTMFVTHDIAESVFLSDRVIAISRRPGRVVKDIKIELPRPRTLDMMGTPTFSKYAKEIREALGLLKATNESVIL